MVRVAGVRAGSIGADLGIQPGTALLAINGADLRDSLDLQFFEAEDVLELEARSPDGELITFEIEKDLDESLGLVPEPDKIRRCTNACPFCFVKGNPRDQRLRSTLYIKDDDYRLSFMYGHYVTLTNLRDDDWIRIEEQRLSPLYVSVHATDPEARTRMLINPAAGRINEHLDRLEAASISYHAQVVLCPGVNDGRVLDRTIDDLYGRGDPVLSLSIVPVGLTAFNDDRGVRPLTAKEARQALRRIDEVRSVAAADRDTAWCYAADELFVQARRPPPGREYFDDRELVGNGVGAISALRDRVREDLSALPALRGQRIVLATGTSMGPTLEELAVDIGQATGAAVAVVAIENSLYGPMVTTAGLIGGRDYLEALRPFAGYDVALVTKSALNDEKRFIDDMLLDELRSGLPELRIWPSEHVTDALRAG
jgi:putative radical SAM enzyme (TIGR03279 family)